MTDKELIQFARAWFKAKTWSVYPFQQKAWNNFLLGNSGIINAPTGSGKTYSLLIPVLLEYIKRKESGNHKISGLQCIWIAPEYGYGNTSRGLIPANSTLIFEVELISIQKADK